MLAYTNKAIDVFKTICKALDPRPHTNLEICFTRCSKYRIKFVSDSRFGEKLEKPQKIKKLFKYFLFLILSFGYSNYTEMNPDHEYVICF